MSKDVCVTIVTYNSEATIAQCIDSVFAQRDVDYSLVVVDNQSQDATLEIVRKYAEKVQLIAHSDNIGFGAGHNLAARQAPPSRYVLILNPDAKLKDSGALKTMVDWMDAHLEQGLCGMSVESDGVIDPPKLTYPGERDSGVDFSKLPGSIAWVLGAAMIMKRELFSPEVSGFDEIFFLYAEETDLCLRIREVGYEIGYVPAANVEHIGGVSAKEYSAYKVETLRQTSLLRFYTNHYTREGLRRIMQKGLKRSRRRIFLRTLLGQGRHPKAEKYRAARDACLAFLKESN